MKNHFGQARLYFVILFSILTIGLELKPQQACADETNNSELKEVGVTLGTPAIGNLVLGYWSGSAFPWVIRISGMDYGSVRGFQSDFGWAFDRRDHFKQYLAVSFAAGHIQSNSSDDVLSVAGIGPTYGLNLYGFTVQVGAVIGSSSTYHSSDGTTSSGSAFQVTGQIGYTYLW